jgi:hypothetical protein
MIIPDYRATGKLVSVFHDVIGILNNRCSKDYVKNHSKTPTRAV